MSALGVVSALTIRWCARTASIYTTSILAKNTEKDDKATRDEKYAWYKITQDGGPVGVIKQYREAIKNNDNVDEIEKALNRNTDLECKKIMRAVLAADEQDQEIDFPVAKGKYIKI